MNPHVERARLLLQQSRHELAETELRQALGAAPDDAEAHALLALCLAEREQFAEATTEAEQAIHLQPDYAFAHYVHAQVFYDRNRFSEALSALNEGIRLDPENATYFALLANIHLQERRWQDCLAAAEQGLQFDSEHVACTNLRAMAMVKLGRRAEAGKTIDAALAKQPENAFTHANQGWTLLEKGDPKKALEHFREALRLDPQNEWARRGIIEALKARHFIYAVMLKYFLWMARLSRRAQWGIMLAGYFGNQMLGAVAHNNPTLAPWILPVRILYIIFALLTWLAYPLFNLLLRTNRFGRLALLPEQLTASNWFGACLLLALAGLAGCAIYGLNGPWLLIALVFGLLLLPLTSVFRCSPGWPRIIMATVTGLILLAGLTAVAGLVFPETLTPDTGKDLLGFFVIGIMGSTWLAYFLVAQRPKR